MNKKEEELLNAAYSGNSKRITELIKEGVSVNIADDEGITPLHNAMVWAPHLKGKNFPGLARLLVEHGADVNAQDKSKATPLYMAAAEGFYETVVYLHSKGAKIDVTLESGFNALHEIGNKMGPGFENEQLTMTREGKEETITDPEKIIEIMGGSLADEFAGYARTAQYLIKNGINVDQTTNEHNQTPLYNALDHDSVEVVKAILEKGVKNINHQDKFGLTVLHWACRRGRPELVKLILQAGADPEIQEEYGFTPLHKAAENNHVPVLKLLIENNADPEIGLIKSFDRYAKGDTAADIASKAGRKKAHEYLVSLKGK